MPRERTFALEAAKEITAAHAGHINMAMSGDTGEQVADYYEAVFKKILELASQSDD